MTAFVASSPAASAGMIPSPLKFVAAKIFAVSAVSSKPMATASFLPRLVKICLAADQICFPSGSESSIAASGSVDEPFSRSSGFFRRLVAHFAAAMTSGTRRARQRDPEFLVKLIQIGEVGAGFQFYLVEAAGAEKFPCVVCWHSFSFWSELAVSLTACAAERQEISPLVNWGFAPEIPMPAAHVPLWRKRACPDAPRCQAAKILSARRRR